MTVVESQKIPSWCWSAYFLMLPFGLPLLMGLVISDLLALCLIIITAIGIISGKIITLGKTDAWFIFFVGCSLLGLEVLRVPDFYLRELLAILFLFVCFKITSDFLSNREIFNQAISLTGNALAILLAINTMAVFSYKTLTQGLAGFFTTSDKLSWPFEFSGQLGISLSLLFPVCLCSRPFPFQQRAILYLMLIVNAGAIASRSVFWLCLFEILYIEFYVYQTKLAVHNILKGLGLFLIIGTLIVFFGENFSFQRSLGQLEASPLHFDEPRIMILRKTLQTLPSWLQGVGLGCFKAFNELEIHNTPLSILVETGFMGFIAAFMFIVTIFQSVWRADSSKHQSIKKGLLISFAAILLHGLFRNLLTNRACWFILALCHCCRHFPKDVATDLTQSLPKNHNFN